MCGNATLVTVEPSITTLDPRTVASRVHRPRAVAIRRGPRSSGDGAEVMSCPGVSWRSRRVRRLPAAGRARHARRLRTPPGVPAGGCDRRPALAGAIGAGEVVSAGGTVRRREVAVGQAVEGDGGNRDRGQLGETSLEIDVCLGARREAEPVPVRTD